ncbi:MAG TPA: hypothetical protein VGA97_01030, partial [Acidimicrobiia bacterium]
GGRNRGGLSPINGGGGLGFDDTVDDAPNERADLFFAGQAGLRGRCHGVAPSRRILGITLSRPDP